MFATNRLKSYKLRCASQVDAKHVLSKPVTSQSRPIDQKIHSQLKDQSFKVTGMNVVTQDMDKSSSHKPREYNLMKHKYHTQKINRRNYVGQKTFSSKPPKTCLKWIPTGRIFKLVGLRWIPISTVYKVKVISANPTGQKPDITNSYKCKQNLHVSAGYTYLNAGTSKVALNEKLRVWLPKGFRPPSLETLDTQQ